MTSVQEKNVDEQLQAQALQWFTRVQSNLMTIDEKSEFDGWYSVSENAQHYDELDLFWDSTEFYVATQRVEHQLGTDENNIPKSDCELESSPINNLSQKKSQYKIITLAASILLLVILSFDTLNIKINADYLTAAGELETVDLSDGSKLTLNTDSAVKVTLDKSFRRVDLFAGEIYLDVTKDPSG